MKNEMMLALMQAKQFLSTLDHTLKEGTFYPFQRVILEADQKALTKGYISLLKKLKIGDYEKCNEEVVYDENIDVIFKRLDSLIVHYKDLVEDPTIEDTSYLKLELFTLEASVKSLKTIFE